MPHSIDLHHQTGLSHRLREVEAIVASCLTDDRGLILSGIDARTRQVFEPGFFEGAHDVHLFDGMTRDGFAGYLAYENVGMASGAYLSALVWQYKATGDPAALTSAKRVFDAICGLYERCRSIAPGFICKCYGGELSRETSSDQYLYILNGLHLYAPLANASDQDVVRRMVGEMVDWWIQRDYQYPYFGRPLQWPYERFPVFSWLAYQHTGERRYLAEFERLVAMPCVREMLPFACRWSDLLADSSKRDPIYTFEAEQNVRVMFCLAEAAASGFLSVEPLLDAAASHAELWREQVEALLECGRHFVEPDGYATGPLLYARDSGCVTSVTDRLHDGTGFDGWSFLRLVANVRSGMQTCMFARALTGMDRFLPGGGAAELACKALACRDLNTLLLWRVDEDGRQLPPRLKWVGHVLSGDAAAHWLWAYWELRARTASS